MLGRYRIVRGRRFADDPLPDGVRQDTRKHTRHVLRPDADSVARYLGGPSDETWRHFAREYLALLAERRTEDREAFDALARLAREQDVWLGCSCPTVRNPDVRHCHTFLALEFLSRSYPDLVLEWPETVEGS